MSSIISITAWRWLFENRANLRFIPDPQVIDFINIFMKNGLLKFEKGHFIFSVALQETLDKIEIESAQLEIGAPISYKQTCTDPSHFKKEIWFRGKTKEKKSFVTNYEMLLIGDKCPYIEVVDSPNLFEIEMLIAQARLCLFREDFLDLKPILLQREDYFSPGIIIFKGERNFTISIAEEYYDLVFLRTKKLEEYTRFVAISVGYPLVVALNPHIPLPYRYAEDIAAILAPCEL